MMVSTGIGLAFLAQRVLRHFHSNRPVDDEERENGSDNQISDEEILLGQIDVLKREVRENERKIAALTADLVNERQARTHDGRLYEQQIFKLKEDLSRVEAEKQGSLSSAILSTKLRDNNPNIADLSDQFRPTKLAEMFSELYDNEWTDAFTAVSKGLTERQTTTFLLDIIMEAYSFCIKEMDTIRSVLSEWYLNDSRQVAVMKMTDKQSKMFQTYLQSICGVSKLADMLSTEVVGKYIMQCVKLCLLMCQTDPPVVILCQGAIEDACSDLKQSDGANAPMGTASNEKITRLRSEVQTNPTRQPFDRDKFKEYTSVGPYLEFVVWPVMFLHEGGPMLGKGVAQGTSDLVSSREEEQWTWKNAK